MRKRRIRRGLPRGKERNSTSADHRRCCGGDGGFPTYVAIRDIEMQYTVKLGVVPPRWSILFSSKTRRELGLALETICR